MKYTVGQVLYVVLKKQTSVYPMQVIEEITKKTLTGEQTSYVLRGGQDPKAQILISEIDGELYDSAEKAKQTLAERAVVGISRLVDAAVAKAKEWYPSSFEAPADDPLVALKKQTHAQKQSLPDQHGYDSPLEDFKAELRSQASSSDDNMITLPDGTKAKIKSLKVPDNMS